MLRIFYAHLAQSVEHFLGKEVVPGSSPGVGYLVNISTKFHINSQKLLTKQTN